MDMKNASIALNQITSFAVNKAIQRATVKAIGRHGLGLFVYAGEDLPEEEPVVVQTQKPKAAPTDVNRSPEGQKLFAKVDAAIQNLTKNMKQEEKKALAEKLKSLVGTANYKAIEDDAPLRILYDAFVKE